MKFILIALSLALLPDLYIWFSYIHHHHNPWSWFYWLPLILIFASLAIGFLVGFAPATFLHIFFLLVLGTVLPKLVFSIISLLGRGIGLLVPHAAQLGNVVGVVMALITLAGAIWLCLWLEDTHSSRCASGI